MGKRILAILAAVLLALVGVVLVLLYAARADDRALEAQNPVTVYTTLASVPAGLSLREALRTELIVQTRVPAAAKPTGALESVDGTNASLVALTELAPGQVVLAAAFGETPEGVRRVNVPTGMLAVSVELSDPARVGTFVTPGSRITVFATYEVETPEATDEDTQVTGGARSETAVWLPDVEVLAVGEDSLTPTLRPTQGQAGQQAGSGGTSNYIVTLAVTPQDAAKLVHGINRHVLYLGLRGDGVQVTEESYGGIDPDGTP